METVRADLRSDSPADPAPEIVDFLRRPSAYPDRTTSVECIETHISWVLLTDRFAYKLKKPVRFDFLDFSTPELRRAACQQEIELNRRLAPQVYLGLVPVTIDARGRMSLDGKGERIDWLVKMRRLRADLALDQRLLKQQFTRQQAERMAEHLVQSYEQLPPLTLRSDDYRQAIQSHIESNESALLDPALQLPAPLIRRIHGAQRRLLQLAPDLLDDRVCDGRVVEGHGDLRPEHVYLTPTPVVIDCIEFNREFRIVDVIDDLGFLAMECDHLGAHWIGECVMEAYRRASGDDPPLALTQFYQSYRACVRAKVFALRSLQQPTPEARAAALEEAKRYLQLAESDMNGFGKPLLIVVRGLPGAGKSTLATALADQLGCHWLQTDALRVELFGPSQGREGFNEGRYRPENREAVYAELFRRADAALQRGESVVLDGTFLSAEPRGRALALAAAHGAEPLLVRCCCPEPVALQRIDDRAKAGGSLSEAQTRFYDEQARAEEPDPPDRPTLDVDSGDAPQTAVDGVTDHLRGILLSQTPRKQS